LFPTRRRPPQPTRFPYTTLFRSRPGRRGRATMRSRRSSRVASASRRQTISSTYDPRVDVATVDEWLIRAWRDDALEVLALDDPRSEEHTSELQSQSNLVCRLLLE